ncbi:unnamed protein product [Amaranthus hypochondriacus]
MDKALDMSLDDIIKSKKSAGRGSGRGGYSRGRGAGGGYSRGHGARGGSFGVNARPSSFTIAKSFRRSKNFLWEHDLFEESLTSAGIPKMESGTELFITNLDTRVSNKDIRDLFSEIGELKRYALHYDKNGQPNGSAEVVYSKRSDAFAAQKRYNNVVLDGRPMRIEIASLSIGLPLAARVNVFGGANGKATRRVVMTQNRSHTNFSAQTNRGNGRRTNGGFRNSQERTRTQSRGIRRGQTQGRGWGRGKKQAKKSADDLDKELEDYHAEEMEIS